MYDILIQNGTTVTAGGERRQDIAIIGGKIAAAGLPGTLGKAKTVVDASDKFVLPGLIDPHVHIQHPFKGGFSADDPYTATCSAAFGGDTMVCDFAIQWDKSISLTETCVRRRAQFDGSAVIDFAFHACPTAAEPSTVRELAELMRSGIPSAKLYMTYSRQGRMANDAVLLESLRTAAQYGGLVGVHAENDALCCYYADLFAQEGKSSPHYFPLCKQPVVEAEAVDRAVYFAKETGGSLYIFHLTCADSLELVRKAKAAGVNVFAETCTHYLTRDMTLYDRADGANFICSPPLRSPQDVEALWGGIQDGTIGIVSSDHCGFTAADKAAGGNDFSKVPNGLPGLEVRLPALYTYGVRTGRIGMSRLVELLSTNPARVFGMYPRKGTLAAGSDADAVIFDPNTARVISPEVLHSPVDWSPFDGETLWGNVETVLLRGKPVILDGRLTAEAGYGQYMERRLHHAGGSSC